MRFFSASLLGLLITCVLLGVSCTTKPSPGPVLIFAFGSPSARDPDTTVAIGGVGDMVVRGSFWAPMGGYILRGGLENRPQEDITIIVTGEQVEMGVAIPIRHRYSAEVRNLQPGSYHVAVFHRYVRAPGVEYAAFRGELVVR